MHMNIHMVTYTLHGYYNIVGKIREGEGGHVYIHIFMDKLVVNL